MAPCIANVLRLSIYEASVTGTTAFQIQTPSVSLSQRLVPESPSPLPPRSCKCPVHFRQPPTGKVLFPFPCITVVQRSHFPGFLVQYRPCAMLNKELGGRGYPAGGRCMCIANFFVSSSSSSSSSSSPCSSRSPRARAGGVSWLVGLSSMCVPDDKSKVFSSSFLFPLPSRCACARRGEEER